MRPPFMVLLGALVLAGPALAQTTPGPPTDQAAIVAPVQNAVVRALNFDQGDGARLRGAREDFTPEGWQQFMKRLDGWLDARGAPTFSSSFVPSGNATILGQDDGALHVVIRGTLKHSQNASTTTYPIVIDVRAGGKPLKIEHLEQTVCIGATMPPCP
jgi:hypothetical protein